MSYYAKTTLSSWPIRLSNYSFCDKSEVQVEVEVVAVRVGVLVRGIGPSYYISRFVRQQMEAFRRAEETEVREREGVGGTSDNPAKIPMFSRCSFLITRSSKGSHGIYVNF